MIDIPIELNLVIFILNQVCHNGWHSPPVLLIKCFFPLTLKLLKKSILFIFSLTQKTASIAFETRRTHFTNFPSSQKISLKKHNVDPQANLSKFLASSVNNSINKVKLLEAVLIFAKAPINSPSVFSSFHLFQIHQLQTRNLFSVSLKKFSIWKYFTPSFLFSRFTGWPGEAVRAAEKEWLFTVS